MGTPPTHRRASEQLTPRTFHRGVGVLNDLAPISELGGAHGALGKGRRLGPCAAGIEVRCTGTRADAGIAEEIVVLRTNEAVDLPHRPRSRRCPARAGGRAYSRESFGFATIPIAFDSLELRIPDAWVVPCAHPLYYHANP